jgi:23S rRNA (cytidine1920-2'-O)/16S rRNA (cytidine1409-2'-O)-methyltransferase
MAESLPYVGRGGLKLRHALDTFALEVRGLTCADFGANIGGFTDCLLQAGAARVYAVDTGYGALAYKLRIDPRVIVMERTNALHAPPPVDDQGQPVPIHLIAIDLAWTPQRFAVPAGLRWLRPGGLIITLIKPQYELEGGERDEGGLHPTPPLLNRGVLREVDAVRVAERTAAALPALGITLLGLTRSPIIGGAGKKRRTGNIEWLALLQVPTPTPTTTPTPTPTTTPTPT